MVATMWNGKKKAVTFSFDDGVTQDERLVKMFDKYGLKCTFNLNSSVLGLSGCLDINGKKISHNKMCVSKVKSVYAGHEIAVHTLTHPFLPTLDDDTVVWQVEKDRQALSELAGYNVQGMAYPCGGANNDDRVADVIKTKTGVKYARTITSTCNFDLQSDLYRFNPTVSYLEVERLFGLGREFIALNPDEPKLFYIWGHSYEMDSDLISWEKFEEFCKLISGKEDIFYGTNSQVLLNE